MKILPLAIAALSTLLPQTTRSQETEYSSKGFSAEITQNGEVKNLRVGDQVFMSHFYLIGDYREALEETDHDARFYQFLEKSPATISSPSADTLVVEKESAVLKNEKYPEGAVYREKITFAPDLIRAEYEVQLSVPITSQMAIFSTICEMPLTLLGAGYQATDEKDSETMGVIPTEFNASEAFNVRGRKLAVAIPGGIITVEAEQGTGLQTEDARRWKEDALRMNLYPRIPWKNTPTTFEPGTKFKWAFTISYAPEEE